MRVLRHRHVALTVRNLEESARWYRELFDPTVVGLDHAAWSVATRADLDRWQELLEARGIVHSAIVDLGVASILNLKDPDGIALALFWDETPV